MNRTDYNSAQSSSFVPVTDSMVQKQDPAGWPMRRRTLDSWGYSRSTSGGRSAICGTTQE